MEASPTMKKTLPPTLRIGAASIAKIGLLSLLVLMSACANDPLRTRAEGAGTGAVIGGAFGYMIGGQSGAIAGAAVGGIAGGIIANKTVDKKRQYAEREAALQLAAAQSRSVVQRVRIANKSLLRDIALLETSARRLQAQNLSESSRAELITNTRRSYKETNDRLNQQLTEVRNEISHQQQVLRQEQELAEQTRIASPGSALRLVSAGVGNLQAHQKVLERAKQQLALLDSRRAF